MDAVFHHVAIRVRSLARSEDFYRDLFGFEAKRRLGDTVVHLARPDVPLVLELIQSEEEAPYAGDRFHLAFQVADFAAALERIARHGLTLAGPPTRVGQERLVFIRDPDGYPIELNDRLEEPT